MAKPKNPTMGVTKHVLVSPNMVIYRDGDQGGSGDYYNGTFSAISAEDGSLMLIKSYGSIAMATMALSTEERSALQRWLAEQ